MKRHSSRTCCTVRMLRMVFWREENKRMWREAARLSIAASPTPLQAPLQLTGIQRAAVAST